MTTNEREVPLATVFLETSDGIKLDSGPESESEPDVDPNLIGPEVKEPHAHPRRDLDLDISRPARARARAIIIRSKSA